MLLKHNRQPARVALIIFVCLVLFCLVQLTWWVMFHFQTSQNQKQFQIEALELRSELLSNSINRQYQAIFDMIERNIVDNEYSSKEMTKIVKQILEDPGVVGFSYPFGSARSEQGFASTGQIDSTFYYAMPSGLVFYLDADLPHIFLAQYNGDLEFFASGHNDGQDQLWIKPGMIRVTPEHKANLDHEARKTTYMFAAESGFFFLIIMAGAFLIYRTLYRSEELKYRQQNFIHSVTHELKAPLASIRLYLETIMTGTLSAEKQADVFPKMIEDCTRLEGLIDNVLEAGHFSKAGYKLKLSPTDLSSDLDEYLNEQEVTATRYQGRFRREISEGIKIKSDYQAMRRAVTALVDNGFKYSPNDRRLLTVSLKVSGNQALLRVSDNGIGIDQSEMANIFKRFYRVGDENSRNYKGSGLGLFLVREIVEAHGGQVTVASDGLDKGSVFTITLPLIA